MRITKRAIKSKYIELLLGMVCIGLWGGFYEFAAAAFSALFLILLGIVFCKKSVLRVPVSLALYGFLIVGIGGGVACIIANDKGVSFLGGLKWLAVFLFWILWNQFPEDRRKRILQGIPTIGVMWTIIAYIAFFVPACKDYFFKANRLGGIFQYSNTYALFLLVGLILVLYKNEWSKSEIGKGIVLLSGIIFTGSRSVLVLLIFAYAYLFIKDKGRRKEKILFFAGTIFLVMVIQVFYRLDISRLFSMTLKSSTLNGRLLYWMDACKVVCKHPLGLGYMGYFFMQPQFQTGYYITRFVHNDILQCALDNGIFSALAVLVIWIKGICTRKNMVCEKMILLVLLLHSLFDFDMQFVVMACIGVMCLPLEASKVTEIKSKAVIPCMLIAGVFVIYFTAALGCEYIGKEEMALKLYPPNTFARENLMQSKEGGEEEADRIIKDNGMLASAYLKKINTIVGTGGYEDVRKYADYTLSCAGYEMTYYNQLIYDMSIALQNAIAQKNMEEGQLILEWIQQMPQRLEKLEMRTSKLAYRINDKPDCKLDKPIESYIESLQGISLI